MLGSFCFLHSLLPDLLLPLYCCPFRFPDPLFFRFAPALFLLASAFLFPAHDLSFLLLIIVYVGNCFGHILRILVNLKCLSHSIGLHPGNSAYCSSGTLHSSSYALPDGLHGCSGILPFRVVNSSKVTVLFHITDDFLIGFLDLLTPFLSSLPFKVFQLRIDQADGFINLLGQALHLCFKIFIGLHPFFLYALPRIRSRPFERTFQPFTEKHVVGANILDMQEVPALAAMQQVLHETFAKTSTLTSKQGLEKHL